MSLKPPAGKKLKLCKENDAAACREYDQVTNLNTTAVQSGNYCGSDMNGASIASDDGLFYVKKEASQDGRERPLNFNWGSGGYDGKLEAGVWTLSMNNTEIGRYDLAAASPLNASEKATVYIPSVKAVLDGANKITRIEVTDWSLLNATSGSFEKLTNLDTFKRVVSNISAETGHYSQVCSKRQDFGQLSTDSLPMSLDVSSFGAAFPGNPYSSSSGCQAESIAVTYEMNGVSYRFDFRPFYN